VRHRPGESHALRKHFPGALARSRRDPLAFVEFYDRLSPLVLRFFARRTWDGQISLELTAETFAKAFEKRADFRGHSESQAASWLWAIARNELNAHWRARAVRLNATQQLGLSRPHGNDEEILRIEELAAAEAVRGALASALADLPVEQREVIHMRVLQELDYDEIGRRVGVSNQVVRARLSRGLRSLGRSERLRSALLD
jgi:RNA polymerase sigma-70 factor (ECF subfamily)